MLAVEVAVKDELRELLPRANFADAFSLTLDDPSLDAVTVAHLTVGRPPHWISKLMRLRDAIVMPLGLRTATHETLVRMDRIGIFPVLSRTPERVVLGIGDRQLDFRLSIDVSPLDERRREVVATTLVQTHNRLGRAYLTVILPFHRWIVPALMVGAGRGA